VVGKSSSKLEEYYSAILKGEEEAIAQIKPGVISEDIFDIAVEVTRKAGIPHYERHHCGHGIGLEVYDPPTIAPGVKAVLESGMVLCIETPYYELGWAGIQIEDTIVVTDKGYRSLSKSSRELIRVGV
ncbi:MAG: M24 family metallopeptidase, partial [Tepidanaerobacteraceae bacterium]|nr:M24 family metallopeptidase [Tepidanaerobacteraceae bacterium]